MQPQLYASFVKEYCANHILYLNTRLVGWQKLVQMENVFDTSELDITKEQEIIKLLETGCDLPVRLLRQIFNTQHLQR